jgi:hypothetical protein
MVQITVAVPDDKLAEFLVAVAQLNTPAPPAPTVPTGDDWTPQLADEVVKFMPELEKRLLFRVADARGRVSLSELSRDFALPGEAALEQDFPTLVAFSTGEHGRPVMPVVAGGSGSDGWYWMPKAAARTLRHAVRRAYQRAPAPTLPPPPAATAPVPAAVSSDPES